MDSLAAIAMPLLFFVLGVPLALRRVPPNRLYGYRTPATLASPEAWYRVNRLTGIGFIAAAVVALGTGLALLAVLDGWDAPSRAAAVLLTDSAIVVLAVIAVAVAARR